MASLPTDPPADRIAELLHRELRTARSAAVDQGTSPDEITADLTERVRRLRRLNDSGWRPGARPSDAARPEPGRYPDPPLGELRDTDTGDVEIFDGVRWKLFLPMADDAQLGIRDDPRRPPAPERTAT